MHGIPFAPSLISTISRKSSKSASVPSPSSDPAERPPKRSASTGSITLVSSHDSPPKKLALSTDLLSIHRQPSLRSNHSSSASSSGTAGADNSGASSSTAVERPAHTLSHVLADDSRVRRSRCNADFLEEVVMGGPSAVEALNKEVGRRFRMVSGLEAVGMYKKFVGTKTQADRNNDDDGEDEDQVKQDPDLPVVFAVPVVEAGRRIVDYYMTWKGKPRIKDIKDRRHNFLDSEFRRVARSIDKEFKRASIYGSSAASSVAYTHSLTSLKENTELETPSPPTPQETKAPSRPPTILIPPPALNVDARHSIIPPSATDSVMSLPYLNMVRGVPLGHRLPLRVTNPDNRFSTFSNADTIIAAESPVTAKPALPTVKENDEESHKGEESENTPILVPLTAESLKAPEVARASTISIRSSHSKSTASSASAKSHKRHSSHRRSSSSSTEFLIVLLDDKLEKSTRTWHGLERQISSRTSAHSTPRRVSPWDGPLARDNGITYRTGPVKPSPANGEESSSEEEWENAPVIPLQAYVYGPTSASGSPPPNGPPGSTQAKSAPAMSEPPTPHQNVNLPVQLQHTPPPQQPPPMMPASAQYALGMMTPMSVRSGGGGVPLPRPYGYTPGPMQQASLPPLPPSAPPSIPPYLASPYNPAYAPLSSVAGSVYGGHSPVQMMRPLRASAYIPVGYQGVYGV